MFVDVLSTIFNNLPVTIILVFFRNLIQTVVYCLSLGEMCQESPSNNLTTVSTSFVKALIFRSASIMPLESTISAC